jgi:hypothetical protein
MDLAAFDHDLAGVPSRLRVSQVAMPELNRSPKYAHADRAAAWGNLATKVAGSGK